MARTPRHRPDHDPQTDESDAAALATRSRDRAGRSLTHKRRTTHRMTQRRKLEDAPNGISLLTMGRCGGRSVADLNRPGVLAAPWSGPAATTGGPVMSTLATTAVERYQPPILTEAEQTTLLGFSTMPAHDSAPRVRRSWPGTFGFTLIVMARLGTQRVGRWSAPSPLAGSTIATTSSCS